jgi:hypothetical protein
MIQPKLAGGSVLDMGPYPLVWIFMTLIHPLSKSGEPLTVPKIHSTQVLSGPALTKRLGGQIDEATLATFKFPIHRNPSSPPEAGEIDEAVAVLKTNLRVHTTPERAVLVQGTKVCSDFLLFLRAVRD